MSADGTDQPEMTAETEEAPEEGDQVEVTTDGADQPEVDAQVTESGDLGAVPIPDDVPGSQVCAPPPEMLPMSTQTDEEEPIPPVETECRETQVSQKKLNRMAH